VDSSPSPSWFPSPSPLPTPMILPKPLTGCLISPKQSPCAAPKVFLPIAVKAPCSSVVVLSVLSTPDMLLPSPLPAPSRFVWLSSASSLSSCWFPATVSAYRLPVLLSPVFAHPLRRLSASNLLFHQNPVQKKPTKKYTAQYGSVLRLSTKPTKCGLFCFLSADPFFMQLD
jgi:hypothetical protein